MSKFTDRETRKKQERQDSDREREGKR
jgi:hypothetical protein